MYDQETQRESLDLLPLHSSQHDLVLRRQGQTSSQQENFMFVSHQTRICSPAELDCVREIKVGGDECLELCQGTVLDVDRISSTLNKEALAEMIAQYERFKYPQYDNIMFPPAMTGNLEHGQFDFNFLYQNWSLAAS